jgi:uncharacterized protein YdeI (YjbR/CyaY-like superfamily)
MKIGKTFYTADREKWRSWLKKHYKNKKEIWLVYYRKNSKKPRISYNNAVDEALCFGWIDSIVKGIDDNRFAQRFTPRRKGSPMSEMNKERVRRLISAGKMTNDGLIHAGELNTKLKITPDIIKSLKQNNEAWKYFQKFPVSYKRIRISYIENYRGHPKLFKKTLSNFIKMTAKNKKFGMIK